MAGLNKVILIGNLGKDPEIKYVGENNPVARFSLATSESYKDKNGEWVETTEWHNIVAWRYLAEKAEKLKKGMQVYIEGKITKRTYKDKDGIDRSVTEIVANSIINLSRKDSSQVAEPNDNTTTDSDELPPFEGPIPEPFDTAADDLPF